MHGVDLAFSKGGCFGRFFEKSVTFFPSGVTREAGGGRAATDIRKKFSRKSSGRYVRCAAVAAAMCLACVIDQATDKNTNHTQTGAWACVTWER